MEPPREPRARAGDRSSGHPTGVETGAGASRLDRRSGRRAESLRPGRAGCGDLAGIGEPPTPRASNPAARHPSVRRVPIGRVVARDVGQVQSRGSTETSASSVAARCHERGETGRRPRFEAEPRRGAASPTGSWTVTRSARPTSSGGGDSTPATTNRRSDGRRAPSLGLPGATSRPSARPPHRAR